MMSSSSGMLPAWVCVVSVSFFAFLVGIGVGCDLMKRHEKAKQERLQEERIARLCRGIFGTRPSPIWLELNGAKDDADAAELLIHFTKVEGR